MTTLFARLVFQRNIGAESAIPVSSCEFLRERQGNIGTLNRPKPKSLAYR